MFHPSCRRPFAAALAAGCLALVAPVFVAPALAVTPDGEGRAGVATPAAMVAGPALPGLEARLAAGGDAALDAFYAARGFAPVFADVPGEAAPERARALLDAVETAADHALPPQRFRPVELRAALARPWDAAAEALFAAVYLDWARALSSGLLEPRRLGGYFDIRPVRPEPAALMAALAASTDADAHLAGLAPTDPDYSTLKARHAAMRALAAEPRPWGPDLANGRTLREGDRGADVAALRARLGAMGYLSEADAPVPAPAASALVAAEGGGIAFSVDGGAAPADLYDPALVEAVRRFQSRHGLNTDGIVGPATRAVLNTGPAKRARQLAVNLERLRWDNGRIDRTARRVMVNLPDFRVDVFEGARIVFTTRAVVGKYRHQTVEFSDTMDHMVVNPTWHVPMSIARNEILPKLRENPGYLAERNMRLASGEDAWLFDWENMAPGDFPGRVRQAPGPGNALGRVKFMFPNNHAIYLHDTPQRGLFRRDNRAYSHGCVRVERPLEFAHYLLEGQVENPERQFDRWLATGREIYVTLDRPLPVHLVYRTAFTDVNGEPAFRADVYRRDARVADALETAGVALPAL